MTNDIVSIVFILIACFLVLIGMVAIEVFCFYQSPVSQDVIIIENTAETVDDDAESTDEGTFKSVV